MGIRSNKNRSSTEQVDAYVGTSYDIVKSVADNLGSLTAVGDNINAILTIDPVAVADDADQVAIDAAQVAADRIAVAADKAIVASDKADVAADLVQTNQDTIDTAADAAATAADRVQTGLDVTSASNSASAASTSESNAAASATQADLERQYSAEWANKAEDSLVSAAAGGDQIDDYSSLHHRNKAEVAQTASETAQGLSEAARDAAQTSETNASNSASAASTSESNAAASETKAGQWAIHPEDTAVPGEVAGTYSALHWAKKAEAAAAGLDHTHSNLTVLDNTTASYTTAEETKLAGIEAEANKYIHPATHTLAEVEGIPTPVAGDAGKSLVVNAAETGYVIKQKPVVQPTLEMDFAHNDFKLLDQYGLEPKTLPQTVDFTRASTGTRFNAIGRLETVPVDTARIDYDPVTGECLGLLIEEGRTNLLTHTEQFDHSSWTPSLTTLFKPNVSKAPDGTHTAYFITKETGQTSVAYFLKDAGTLADNTVVTASFFVKQAGASSTRIAIRRKDSQYIGTIFNMATEQFSDDAGVTDRGFERLADGWFRVWVAIDVGADALNASVRAVVYPAQEFSHSYTGDGTSGIYVWGAQLEEGSFPTSYIPSTETFTSRASTATYYDASGILQTAAVDEERLTYNPSDLTAPASQLFEESRTNLLLHSEAFDNAAWTKINTTVTANTTTAPDGSVAADKLVESNSTGNHELYQVFTPAASGQYTISAFLSEAELTKVILRFSTGLTGAVEAAEIDISSGQATVTSGSGTAGVQVLPGGWVRGWLTVTGSASPSSTQAVIGSNLGTLGDGTSGIYIWGAQLEEGAYPTSYIPTTTTTVTRAADVYSSAASTRAADSAFKNLGIEFNKNAFTVVAQGFDASLEAGSSPSNRAVISIDEDANSLANTLYLYRNQVGGHYVGLRDSGNTEIAGESIPGSGGTNFALSWDGSTLKYAVDGVYGEDTGVGTFNPINPVLRFGGHKSAAITSHSCTYKATDIYPYAMTQAELEAITS